MATKALTLDHATCLASLQHLLGDFLIWSVACVGSEDAVQLLSLVDAGHEWNIRPALKKGKTE